MIRIRRNPGDLFIWVWRFEHLNVWALTFSQLVSRVAAEHPWAVPLAYVAAIVFVLILLAGVYLIFLAVRQRKREDRRT